MAETANYGLYYTESTDNPSFLDWRTALAGQAGNMAIIDAALAGKGEILTGTLLASGWENNQQSVTFTGLGANQTAIISVSPTATSAQEAAAGEALLKPVFQTENIVTVEAAGAVPAIDIPLALILL